MKSQVVDHTAAYFALAGALGASVIVALVGYFAQRAALKAERERLEATFRHEREMADLRHLRDMLDHAGEAYEKYFLAVTDVVSYFSAPPPNRELLERAGLGGFSEVAHTATRTYGAVLFAIRRLELRLPAGRAPMLALGSAVRALREAHGIFQDSEPDENVEAEKMAKANECVDRAAKAHIKFAEASERMIGTRLADAPGIAGGEGGNGVGTS